MAMVYSALANGGIAYQPRLIKSVVGADGKPILNEKGQPIVSPNPKVRRDLRFDVGATQIEQARRALYSVVNEGGTGGRARLPNVAVAGKTGSAQAMTDGKSDTIAWFACFAPYIGPKYVVAVMVQGGKGGGAVAAPIANRILGRIFAMDEGKFDAQLAWLEPARKPNPFQFHDSVDFKDSGLPGTSEDETNPSDAQSTDSQLAATGPAPDVELEADASGRVAGQKRVRVAPPPPPPPRKLNFFERLFGVRPKPTPPPPPPQRRPPGRR
jgi:membrane peptidoglycan carboxypeptidase